jgi:hypothetical protein
MHSLLILDGFRISVFSIVLVLVMVHGPLIEVAAGFRRKLDGCDVQLWSEAQTLDLFVFIFLLESLSVLFVFGGVAVHDVSSLLSVHSKCAPVQVSTPCAYSWLMSWSYLSLDAALAFYFMLAVYVILPIL